jgi:LSD1 subclass zinc finger protein
MCDFCGSFTDIDFTIGMDKWNESALNTVGYHARKMQILGQAQAALARGDRKEYFSRQWEFWNDYYQTFPAYLPPTIDDDVKYRLYLEVCSQSSTESAFDPKWQHYALTQQQLQANVQYFQNGFERKAESSSFFALADFFVKIMREGMRSFYEDPRYDIMHELLPESVHLKMKMSMFVQAWLPYLTDSDAERLLKMLAFSNEYVETSPPPGNSVECTSCRCSLFAPEGSYRVFCEACRKTTAVRSSFYCMSCGAPNQVHDNPARPVPCANCGIANRLINPLLG